MSLKTPLISHTYLLNRRRRLIIAVISLIMQKKNRVLNFSKLPENSIPMQ